MTWTQCLLEKKCLINGGGGGNGGRVVGTCTVALPNTSWSKIQMSIKVKDIVICLGYKILTRVSTSCVLDAAEAGFHSHADRVVCVGQHQTGGVMVVEAL